MLRKEKRAAVWTTAPVLGGSSDFFNLFASGTNHLGSVYPMLEMRTVTFKLAFIADKFCTRRAYGQIFTTEFALIDFLTHATPHHI